MLDRLNPSTVLFDTAFVEANFDQPGHEAEITAHERRIYEAAHPGACNAKLEAEAAGELLAALRDEQRRCFELKERCDLLTERHVGKRRVPLTRHVGMNYVLMASASVAGIFVGTWALSKYAADSGVIAALDDSFLNAFMMAFPVIAAAQMLKATGAFCKDDAAKRQYYNVLTKLGLVAAATFVASSAVAFAPHVVDVAAMQDALTTGGAPPNVFVSACKAVAPYFVVGAGLLTEVFGAAVIANRADQLNELGRAVIQGVSPTQLILDGRVDELQAKIELQAEKTAALQAAADLHEATIAERIAAAKAHAHTLAAEYAAHKARSRKDFLDRHGKKDG